jgi:hypothetical protein
MKKLDNINQISTTIINNSSITYLIITALCNDGSVWVKKGTEDWFCVNEKN